MSKLTGISDLSNGSLPYGIHSSSNIVNAKTSEAMTAGTPIEIDTANLDDLALVKKSKDGSIVDAIVIKQERQDDIEADANVLICKGGEAIALTAKETILPNDKVYIGLDGTDWKATKVAGTTPKLQAIGFATTQAEADSMVVVQLVGQLRAERS